MARKTLLHGSGESTQTGPFRCYSEWLSLLRVVSIGEHCRRR